MHTKLNERESNFLDYKITEPFIIGATSGKASEGDVVVDDNGFPGLVLGVTEHSGILVDFIDDRRIFVNNGDIRVTSKKSDQAYRKYKKLYGYVAPLARIMYESLQDHFPFCKYFFNGRAIYVKASTLSNIVKGHTHATIGKNHSYVSIKFTHYYNIDIESVDVAQILRKSRFLYNVLRDMFVDVDLNFKQNPAQGKFIIYDNTEHNKKTLAQIKKIFSKFGIEIKT